MDQMDQTWPLVDVIMPTWNNREYLEPCLRSLFREQEGAQIFRLWIVNNGEPGSCDWVAYPGTTILEPGENLGWTRALATAMPFCTAPIVGFMNDDIFFPRSSRGWMNRLIRYFSDERVAAVGPALTERTGPQSIFTEEPDVVDARMLIGCCTLLWREALEEVGGVDVWWFTADDLDLSIRLRDAGYILVADKRELVYHHGGITGAKVYGSLYESDGWRGTVNSKWVVDSMAAKHGWTKLRELNAPNPPAYIPPADMDAAAEAASADAASIHV